MLTGNGTGLSEQALIVSLGIDIIEVARVRRDVTRYGRRFVERILGERELSLYDSRRDKAVFLSGRFAAKEAVIKSLGTVLKTRPALNTIEIVNDPTGRPLLALPAELADRLSGARCLVSITHERHYASAVAILEEVK
jgi:holo-[acyl-carrier protein] synthase